MRTFPMCLLSCVFIACGVPAEPSGAPPDEPVYAHALTIPVRHVASHELTLYAHRDSAEATEETTLSYALGDDYPRQVTVSVKDGYVLGKGCQLNLGTVVWRSIIDQQGTAAQVELVAGKLTVALRAEGTVSVLLAGEINAQHCQDGSGAVITTVPLQHRVVLQVQSPAGLVVDQFHQQLANCWDKMVLPSGVPLWTPVAHPLNAAGQRFDAVNAPTPVTMTLWSSGALLPEENSAQLAAEPGMVLIKLDTKLPVLGLQSFTVVDKTALTDVQAALYLRKAVNKGDLTERIEDGKSYQLFFPERTNTVDVRVSSATTALGKLCDNVPAAWFAATSETPAQCAARVGDQTDPFAPLWVATIAALGECRLAVKIPGTNLRWATRFTTTGPL